ncbi:sulfotransferase [Flexistipes sinusarabici DSM 4947]|uniref:Sulfotransferase n=1 Tax=Flexistipes sinusarabici (strain ATCC 49648 / DSM 4947 / MAS 10) TaxID=717231 RepID=F8E8J3_FLESM|nr:sulfotransferase [Flexistipes sinusarabici]AEI14042.1 sulfotransferase [Flexistipes sinusarabici DSM 4947]
MNKSFYVIIGVQKSGTTTIYDLLGRNKDIYAPEELKDFHIFNDVLKNYKFIKKYETNVNKSLHCGVNYITDKISIKEILKFNPDTKFLLILRDPIKRAISAYKYALRMGMETKNFQDAIEVEMNKKDYDKIEPNKDYLIHGLYYKQITENLLPYTFNKKNIGIFLYEDIFRNDDIFLSDIINFLGINNFEYPSMLQKNVQGEPIFKSLNRIFYHQSKLKSLIASFIPLKARSKIKQIVYENNYIKAKKDQDVKYDFKLLKDFFYKDVNNLSTIINRDLRDVWLHEK